MLVTFLFNFIFWLSVGRAMVSSVPLVGRDGVEEVGVVVVRLGNEIGVGNGVVFG